VFDEIERDPGFARKMLAGMSKRLHSLISDVESYSLQSGTQRLVGYLLRDDLEHSGDGTAYVVMLPTSKAVVASRLNVTPEHLSRILHDLTSAGLIEVNGREVTIVDVDGLRAHRG
jgi:CRP-like cAMP-binding protein